jgi:hypothetical protein
MVKKQVQQVQSLMEEVMTEGEHYANPKWASSPILKKAGAEKISFAFRLSARFDTQMRQISHERADLPPGHREYVATCRIFSQSGQYLGMAKGSCSTAEPKYRYRKVSRMTDFAPPKEFWNSYSDSMANADFSILRDLLREKGEEIPPSASVGCDKDDETGNWHITVEGKGENDEIEAQYNTCLKMSQKRAYVGAVQQSTAVSDIFTQDLDDPDLARQVKEEKGHSQSSSSQGSSSQSRSQRSQSNGSRRSGGGKGRARSAPQQRRQPQSRGSTQGTPPGGRVEMVEAYGVTLKKENAKHVQTARESLQSRPSNVSFDVAADQIRDHYSGAPEPLQEAIGYMIADERPEGTPSQEDSSGPDTSGDAGSGEEVVTLPEDTPFRDKLVDAGITDTAQLEEAWKEGGLVETVEGVGPKRAKRIAEEMGFAGESEVEQAPERPGDSEGSGDGESWDEGDPQSEFEEDPPF